MNAVELRESFPLTDVGLMDALDALGRNDVAVAATLRRLGIRGQRGVCGRCPIANYLATIWPGYDFVEVEPDVAAVWRGHQRVQELLPAACVDFVREFDTRRDHQDLLEGGAA